MCRDIRNGCQSLFDRICKCLWPKYVLLMLSINIIKNAELKTLPCLTPDSELNNIMYENIFYLLFYYTCTWIIYYLEYLKGIGAYEKPYIIFGFRCTDFYNILYYRNIFSTIYKI